jgi:hypothetical protein
MADRTIIDRARADVDGLHKLPALVIKRSSCDASRTSAFLASSRGCTVANRCYSRGKMQKTSNQAGNGEQELTRFYEKVRISVLLKR